MFLFLELVYSTPLFLLIFYFDTKPKKAGQIINGSKQYISNLNFKPRDLVVQKSLQALIAFHEKSSSPSRELERGIQWDA
jgi:hypothetical protein